MKSNGNFPGFMVVLVIATCSYGISFLHASFDPLVISIIFGMLLGNIVSDRQYFSGGVHAALAFFLPVGIALYGSQLVFRGLGASDVMKILAVFVCLFFVTFVVSRSFSLNSRMSVLLASGLAVCGASAIAIVSPLIGARREDTSVSIISIMVLGLAGMIFYPVFFDVFSLSRSEYNFLTGTTLPMLGQVKVAASTVNPQFIEEALRIKVIRISFLVFLVTFFVLLSRKAENKVTVPWFVVVFVILAVVFNAFERAKPLLVHFRHASSFSLSAALAAIGFSVDFDLIVEEGLMPISAVFLSWSATVLLIYLVRNLF